MFGIEISEVFLFLKQLGFALAGASALWGAILSRKDFHCGEKGCLIYDWLSLRLLGLLAAGTAISAIAFLALLKIFPVYAHEGIAVFPTAGETISGLLFTGPILLIGIFLTLAGLFVKKINPSKFAEYLTSFFVIQFIIFFVLASVPAVTQDFDSRQVFFIGHGFHSIFTLGSVIVLDFLFLTSKRSSHLVQHVVPLFPTISKIIWVGFGFDLLSATFILPLAEITSKVVFMQTVVGILLINGVLLSGPIARRIMKAVGTGGDLSAKWEKFGDLAGTISITSWATITAVDSFQHLSLSYGVLLGSYAAVMILLYFGHRFISERQKKLMPPVFIH